MKTPTCTAVWVRDVNVNYYVRMLCGLTHLKEQLSLGCKRDVVQIDKLVFCATLLQSLLIIESDIAV